MVTGNNTLFETIPEEMVIEIEIERLRDFHGHPFKVRDDDQMKSLRVSILTQWMRKSLRQMRSIQGERKGR